MSFRLDGADSAENFLPAADAEAAAARHLCFAEKRKAETVILFGLGDGQLAQTIAQKKPHALELIICDLFPAHVRKLIENHLTIIDSEKNTRVLTDSSIWSILLLLRHERKAENCHLILNPDLTGKSKDDHRTLQRIFSGLKTAELPTVNNYPTISAGAILSPDEPGLNEFIAALPGWLKEISIVWDCPQNYSFPQLIHPDGVQINSMCHPLDADFGAQRNRMLKNCSGEWVVYLDADERLDASNWDSLRRAASLSGCEGWYLPRETCYPDENHVRVGYGLWPDLQLRFFRNTGRLRFVNRIHERIEGLSGPSGILPGVSIIHLTHLLKSRERIEAKLESFNLAAGGAFCHRLGAEFPNVHRDILCPEQTDPVHAVILPEFNL
ncbi:glycosyltransferase [Maridesulfovibrio sp. FT414]|uniref:glycosyltransferase n=1 Tax=Maridesulfovibrio sp. FT414 TaxID=2979469 RepID=UPI003D802FD0